MGLIAEKRLTMLKGLVRTLPPASLRSLEMALGLTNEPRMVEVRELIVAEIEFRRVREAVFAPYMPLFRPREDGLAGVRFAPWIVNALWSALEKSEPDLHAQAQFALRSLRPEDPTPVVFFRLVAAAADFCNHVPETILPPDADAETRAEVAEFGRYLDLHRLARQVLSRLSDFMGRIDADKAAALRVIFNDASDLDIKGGTRFLEIIFANLDEGAQIIKFVAIVSDRPNDRFLAMSELADFGTRILDRIENGLAELRTFMGVKGQVCDDLDTAGDRVAQCLGQLQAFGQYIELTRDGPWGKRVTEAQKAIAALVEHQFSTVEKSLDGVMPMRVERVYGRVKKEVPDFARVPSDEVLARANSALLFIRKVRHIAVAGGFAALHAKISEACELTLDAYFTELLALANGDEPFDAEQLLGGFERITDLMESLCGAEKGQIARRRVASSDLMNPSKSVA